MYWQAVEQQIKKASNEKKLFPITTTNKQLLEHEIQYTLHIRGQNSVKKPHQTKQTGNPFSPHEPAMFVRRIGSQHKLLLNKFPVLNPHALLCSNDFVCQQTPLTKTDFEALLSCLNETRDIGFYNAGPTAGASQGHRHMQLIKLDSHQTIKRLSASLSEVTYVRWEKHDATTCFTHYQNAMKQFSLNPDGNKTGAYNLILTSELFWLIPRSTAHIDKIFANGLNFCGHFLVKNEEQMTILKKHGVLQFLKDIIA